MSVRLGLAGGRWSGIESPVWLPLLMEVSLVEDRRAARKGGGLPGPDITAVLTFRVGHWRELLHVIKVGA